MFVLSSTSTRTADVADAGVKLTSAGGDLLDGASGAGINGLCASQIIHRHHSCIGHSDRYRGGWGFIGLGVFVAASANADDEGVAAREVSYKLPDAGKAQMKAACMAPAPNGAAGNHTMNRLPSPKTLWAVIRP